MLWPVYKVFYTHDLVWSFQQRYEMGGLGAIIPILHVQKLRFWERRLLVPSHPLSKCQTRDTKPDCQTMVETSIKSSLKKHHLASWSRIFDKLNYLSGQTCMRDLQSRVVKFCFLQTFYIYIVNYFVFIKCLLSVISKHFQVQSLKNFVPSGLLRHWLWSPLTLSNVII